jgi:diguanylate cyclase (GGDEF)-like protein
MPPAPLPTNESARLAALAALEILDTPAEEVFDSFARVASALFDAPVAAVSLIAADRHWFKAVCGLPGVSEVPRDVSFCAHAILEPGAVLAVPDAAADPRFSDNPLVTGGPGIRFYAGAPVLDAEGFPLGALCVLDRAPREPPPAALERLRDAAAGVSAALRLHGALRRLDAEADRDALTGLGNRRAFEARLADPAGADGATLLLLDLDGFKGVNDTFGHPAGDAALREAARRIGAATRRDGTYRLGGDEFAVLVPEALGDAGALALGARVHAALADTFSFEGHAVPLRASIGAASLAATAGRPGTPAAALVPLADAALYEAKRAGRGTTRAHRAPPAGRGADPAPGGGRLDLEARLRRALAPPPGGEPFVLAFQPVVDLPAGEVNSLEALVRWSPRPGGAVPPGEFVPLAERTGLAPRLDRWVLRAACGAAAAWPRPWAVSVNVSAVTFGLTGVAAMVRDALAETGLPPGRLIVEMTETALAADAARAGREVEALRASGVRVALDDLGAGHASLLALRRHPFTEVKVDRGLVSGIDADPAGRRIVGFIAELGALAGFAVVAEGVERAAELREVEACGIARAQGFFLARPAPAGAVAGAARAAAERAREALARGAPAR